MTGRNLLLVVATFCCIVVLIGSGGFSSVSAEGGVAVTVADDESAYLGVQTNEPRLENGNHQNVTLLTVTNQFPAATEATVMVTIPSSTGPPPVVQRTQREQTTLGAGESTTVTADVTCGGTRTAELPVDISVSATDGTGSESIHDVELQRDVAITCTGNPPAHGKSTPDGSAETDSGTTTSQAS